MKGARRPVQGQRRNARSAAQRSRALIAGLLAALLAAALLVSPATARTARGGARAVAAANTPPKVTKNPASVTVEEGQGASFTATASGSPAPTVQWERSTNAGVSWSPIEGATATTLTIPSTSTAESGNQLRARFKNLAGEVVSKTATLTVQKAPQVTLQPAEQTVEEGQNAVFEAAASGSPAPTVQWQASTNGGKTWANVSGATANRLTITGTTTALNGHQYRAVFTNPAGTADSAAAVLTVRKAPQVTHQPASTTVDEGETATFEATASGFPPPTVQWEVSTDEGTTWAPVEGANSTRLSIQAVVADDGYEYRAVFSNAAGTATSNAARLTVHAPPVVTLEPASATVLAGEAVTFEAAASGYPAPTVQWESSSNGGSTWSAVEGATSDQLTIGKAEMSENGRELRAVFTNVAGKATSDSATLTVASSAYAAVAWGQNTYRQLGNGSLEGSIPAPVPVSGLRFVTAVAGGGRHSLALLANGTVEAWGYNEFGQLGDGTTNTRPTPVAVHGLSGVKAIAAGADHSLALLSNGTVMAWGENESGQLGNGGTADSELPVAVKGLTNVRAIAAGGDHSLALLANGTVMAWGENQEGELGNGGTKGSAVPVTVKGLTGVSSISAGATFNLAVLAKGGAVEAWGSDMAGQLGDNGPTEEGFSPVPVPVEGLSGVAAVAAGNEHGLALLSGGTVMAWGEDNYGELGNGTTQPHEGKPVPVSGLSGVSAISAGDRDSVALLTSGSVVTWGMDTYGELGNGVQGSPSSVPVEVGGLRKAASISAGGFHVLAFGEPVPAVTGVAPNVGPAAGGNSVTITGASLTGASAVKFGAVEATSFKVESSTTVVATAPPGAAGTVDVTVTTPDGTSAPSRLDRYTYQQVPTVTSVKPKSGPVAGGTPVSIKGSEFTAAVGVGFGGVPATSYKVVSATEITAVAPAGAAGTVQITVTNSAGTSAATSKAAYRYTPTVTGLTPSSGTTAGGTVVTVTGTGFVPGATSFSFGTAAARTVECTSSTSCSVTTPAHAAGTLDVIAKVAKSPSPANPPGDRFTFE